MGKKKNHWALRFIIRHKFSFRQDGRDKVCSSVRVSVETPPGSLKCQKLTMKAMGNTDEISRSAYVSFTFDAPQQDPGRTVQEFVAEANSLLPFTYKIVAQTLADKPGAASEGRGHNAGQSGRNQELLQHPNGCRDFTAQWFYRLHNRELVVWEARAVECVGNYQPIQETEAFHHLIGYRYSPERVDRAPIAKATFPAGFNRLESCTVRLVMNPEAGEAEKDTPGKFKVVLPYQDQPPAVQTFKRS